MISCYLCNAALPQGLPVQRKTVAVNRTLISDAPLCRKCADEHERVRVRAENITGVIIIGIILLVAVKCACGG